MQSWHVLLPDARDAKVLLRSTRSGWSLPEVQLDPAKPWWRCVADIHAQVRRSLQLDATVLRCIEVRDHFDPGHALSAFVLESSQLNWARPAGTDWFGQDELGELELEDERQLQALERYFSDDWPEGSPPWARRGWLGSTISWLEGEFDRVGVSATDRVHQLRASSSSAVFRVPLGAGSAYLKVCGEGKAHEPDLSALLARECPRLLPPVLATDAKRRLLLTADAGRPATIDATSAEWLLRGLAEVQIQMCEHPERLLEVGCPDARPELLRTQLDSFLERLARCAASDAGLARLDLEQLTARLAELSSAWGDLAEGEVPPSLHHTAFGPESVVEQAGQLRVIDWHAVLSHPFFSPSPLIESFASPEVRERLLDLYLTHWLPFAPMDRLRALHARARSIEAPCRAMAALRDAEQARGYSERRFAFDALLRQLEPLTI